jgi:phosphoglycerate dehydrogenase-like enzyme
MAPLEKFVVGATIPTTAVDRLRSDFPAIEFVVAESDQIETELIDADAAIVWGLSPAQLAAAPRLRWIQTVGAGVDGILIPELLAREIAVTNNSGVHALNMAEHVLAMMLAFARQLPFLMRGQMAHQWRDDAGRGRVFELAGQTVLLVGLGDIACAVAVRAAGFGLKTIAVRRRPELPIPPHVDAVAPIADLPAVLPQADHVVITLPLTARTRGLFDHDMLGHCRRGAYLYNVGRGPTVDTQALVTALKTGGLAGAGLDVIDPEPLPEDSPLWDMEQVIITAHTAGATPRYWDRAYEILAENIRRFSDGRPMINVVDRHEGY